jgi:hypothetical protein
MMDEQAALRYLAARMEALHRDINFLRANLQADIDKTQVRLNGLPPSALTEAQKLIDTYKDVMKRLEGF